MFSIKLSFNNEFRRMAVPIVSGKPSISMDELVAIARKGYSSIGNKEIALLWTDEDGDTITVSTNEELQFALACMLDQSANVFKFAVDVSKSIEQESTPAKESQPAQRKGLCGNSSNPAINTNVTCDECGVAPIVGVRFKCAVRNDFDLCEQCEGRNAQPYPMIKIYDPEQAPVAIMIAVRDRDDDPHRGHPLVGRHGHGPHGHGPHHPHHPHHRGRFWGGQGPHGKHAGPAAGHGVHIPPHCGGKKWERTGCPMKSKMGAFFNAFEEFVAPTSIEPKPKSDDMQALEQTLVEEAVRASLEEHSVGGNLDTDNDPSVTSDASASSMSSGNEARSSKAGSAEVTKGTGSDEKEAHLVTVPVTLSSSPGILSSMRFIRDVTFPDGSKVQPGTVLSKVWRVRNEGDSVWPEGTVLTTAGGDLLTTAQHAELVPQAQPGEEIEIGVTLTAPRSAGRHVAYFRLQNANGVNFGQRLWADIVVEEEDPTWAVVSSMTLDSTLKALDSSDNSVTDAVLPSSASTVGDAKSVESDKVPVTGTVASVGAVATSTSAVELANNVWSRVWAAELEVLSQMGFVDTKALIPLLQQHVSVPVSLAASGSNGVPNAEGMQRVVMHLLGQSI